jgi:alkane 1-monooxygenase
LAGIVLFVLQAGLAVFMLEGVSYIEHYGLLRSRDALGKYQPMSPANSWDCYGQFSSYLVFQLQRHADHHAYPTRSYASLGTADDAQKLPVGYPLMIGIAMLPRLWRRIMDRRVQGIRAQTPALNYETGHNLSSDH